mgnify:CR=1 FL=1
MPLSPPFDTPVFDDIRSYTDAEAQQAFRRIAQSAMLPKLASFIFPHSDIEDVRQLLLSQQNIYQYQHTFMVEFNKQVISNSITHFTYDGLEHIDPSKNYLFISNHRDIVLDASLMQYIFATNDIDTTEISFGANLMSSPLLIDIGRSNKMFRVERPQGLNGKELYSRLLHLSHYIRYNITTRRQSVWIAQRNGRTKDGHDHTDQGIIKMFSLSHDGHFADSLSSLHLLPVSISYEWEPCDVLKCIDTYQRTRNANHSKTKNEDLISIITGILQPKGNVHITFCPPVTTDELHTTYTTLQQANQHIKPSAFHSAIAQLIDRRIISAYRLHANNYIAADISSNTNHYAAHYNDRQRNEFHAHLNALVRQHPDMADQLVSLLLDLYANPIRDKQNLSLQK